MLCRDLQNSNINNNMSLITKTLLKLDQFNEMNDIVMPASAADVRHRGWYLIIIMGRRKQLQAPMIRVYLKTLTFATKTWIKLMK